MSPIKDLEQLLRSLQPELIEGEFVFISRASASYGDGRELNPVAAVAEQEGLTLIVPREQADAANEAYNGVFRMITLQVNSSLHAIGLTAAVSRALAKNEISANVLAGFHHDHIFVPSSQADDAVAVLNRLSADS